MTVVALVATTSLATVNVAFAVAVLILLAWSGSYRDRLTLTATEDAPLLVTRVALSWLFLAPWALVGELTRHTVIQASTTAVLLIVGRAVSYGVIRQARRSGHLQRPVLIIGEGIIAGRLERVFNHHPEYGLRPVPVSVGGASVAEGSRTQALPDIRSLLDEHGARRIVVAFSRTREAAMVSVIRTALMLDVEVHVVPRFFELGPIPRRADVDDIWGIPLQLLPRAANRQSTWRLKRIMDAVFAAVLLVAVSPVIGVCALGVRVSSRGPILFRQHRVGQHGRMIEVLKFRTLRVEPPRLRQPEMIDADPLTLQEHRQQQVEASQTAFGRFLRATSLDELPQLCNVLRGDMSLVGPRPEEVGYAVQYSKTVEGYAERHRLPVGLTGWAQVHGLRGPTSIDERARFDNYYIEHWTIWRDVSILLRTVGAVGRQVLCLVRNDMRQVRNDTIGAPVGQLSEGDPG